MIKAFSRLVVFLLISSLAIDQTAFCSVRMGSAIRPSISNYPAATSLFEQQAFASLGEFSGRPRRISPILTSWVLIGVLLMPGLSLVGCGGGGTVTAPPPPATTLDFGGTVPVGGRGPSHNFTASGHLKVVLQTIIPAEITLGFGIGVPVPKNSSCAIFTVDQGVFTAPATVADQPLNAAGKLCVQGFDAGGLYALTGPVQYTIQVIADTITQARNRIGIFPWLKFGPWGMPAGEPPVFALHVSA
jgi:hypothetical protein